MWAYGWSPDLSRKVSTFSEIALSILGIKSSISFTAPDSHWNLLLTDLPWCSPLFQHILCISCPIPAIFSIASPYLFVFCSHSLSIVIALHIPFGVLASIRIICCQRYCQPLSEYFWMLVASSQTYQPFPEYLWRSPVKSFTGLWHLWNQIIQLM